jgi:hypothetical protein
MKSTFVLAATAAVASAQVTTNPNGTFTCAKPNVNYCAGDSLGTDIIFRCNAAGVAQPGRCTDVSDTQSLPPRVTTPFMI